MNRLSVIQSLIDKNGYKNYLEIGVYTGEVFFNVECENKIAVDPSFAFTEQERSQAFEKSTSNLRAKYYETTSDEFFKDESVKLSKEKIDICFVDGMHEFDASLKDVENTLRYLTDNGVIVMHDCNPTSAEATVPFQTWVDNNVFTKPWNGDVWKTIVYLKTFRKDLDVFVADCDFGLGIVSKKNTNRSKGDSKLNFSSKKEIGLLSYSDLETNRVRYLNLRSIDYLQRRFDINWDIEKSKTGILGKVKKIIKRALDI